MVPVRAHAMGSRPERMLTLRDVLAPHGFSKPLAEDRAVAVRNADFTLVFLPGYRKVSVNGLDVFMNAPLTRTGRHYGISAADAQGTLLPLLTPPHSLPGWTGIRRVLIDPGHGGGDTGAVSARNLREKDVVLDIARRTRLLLTAHGLETMLTRTNDTAIPLVSRPEKAGEWKADLFVSIHLNSSANPAATGVETFLMPAAGFPTTASTNGSMEAHPGNRFDALNMRLAYSVHKEVLAGTRAADRGVRRARFAVLRAAPCPAILVECGFLSNDAEEERIAREDHRQAIAQGIANGILALRPSR